MITFDVAGVQFHLRAAAVCLHDGHVLLHRAEVDPFWSLPGGRVEPSEETRDAVRRECREEMGAEVSVGRLLWVIESFFELGGKRQHEIGFYYSIELQDPQLLDKTRTFSGTEGKLRLIFRWFPAAELEQLELVPAFLKGALANPPSATEHIIHRDGSAS